MIEFRVKLYSADGSHCAEMTLPFAPYPGLLLQAEWLRGDFIMVALVGALSAMHRVLCAGDDGGDELSDMGLRQLLKDAERGCKSALKNAGVTP